MFSHRFLKAISWYVCFGLAVSSSGCSMLGLHEELVELTATYGLNGKIYNLAPGKIPTVVVLYRVEASQMELVDYSILDPVGHYSFMVSEGDYYIAAYEDRNHDLSHQDGEKFGCANQSRLISVTASGPGVQIHDIDLNEASGYCHDLPREIEIDSLSDKSWIKVGVVTDLDNPVFVQKNGYMGYWKPLTFMRDVGIGIYFLEPYDPSKIPILFVHGANGTPIGFRHIVEKMDRSRYQAWFYYYPSGLRIDTMAYALNELIKSLDEDYNFEEIAVIAHSMGGLVSRAFIRKNAIEDGETYIRKLISMSTPWAGVRTAEMGVKNAPVAVPSWHDVAPDSDLLRYIYEKPLPDQIAFYLLFGVRGDFSLMMGNNDGTIELASEIDYRAQEDAVQVFPFNEDHDSILSSERVIGRINKILE